MAEKIIIQDSHHESYFRIAKEHLKLAQNSGKKWVALLEKPQLKDGQERTYIYQIVDSICISTIFSAFTAEAFINDYLINRKSKQFLQKYCDKLDLLAKWLIIPQIINGRSLDQGGKAMQNLDKLISARNKLAHHKTSTQEMEYPPSQHDFKKIFPFEAADNGVKTIRQLIDELHSIDNTVDKNWTT